MISLDDFRKHAHQFVDWMADYLEEIESLPVRSKVSPGDIYAKLPGSAPMKGASIGQIFEDFKAIVMPGVTHWQHPNFHAFFPANSSYPSVLAEMLTATIGAQCMLWETSPAAAELEEKVLNWLKPFLGIPHEWSGVIQDTASTATLVALLTAREVSSSFTINKEGLYQKPVYRIYCSTETHSSIEKDVKIAGFGAENLVKVAVKEDLSMDPEQLEGAIKADISKGYQPLCIICTLGTTGTLAVDPVKEIGVIARRYDLWNHIDAAYAGVVLMLEEYKWMIDGIENADSFVFNPHKWMLTNFDCSLYYVRSKELLIRTFEILPEYLKTSSGNEVNNYRDWGIPLGRRFRALKLWFVIRNYGIEGIKGKIISDIKLAKWLENQIELSEDFENIFPRKMNMVFFRFHPSNIQEIDHLNQINKDLKNKLNDSGRLYVTHYIVRDVYFIRLCIGSPYVTLENVKQSWEAIQSISVRVGH